MKCILYKFTENFGIENPDLIMKKEFKTKEDALIYRNKNMNPEDINPNNKLWKVYVFYEGNKIDTNYSFVRGDKNSTSSNLESATRMVEKLIAKYPPDFD